MSTSTETRQPVRLPRYPAGLIIGMIPRSSTSRRRRRGGFSLGRFVYFGSHPLLVIAGVIFYLFMVAFMGCLILAWIALVTSGWLVWMVAAAIAWLAVAAWRLAAPHLRRHQDGEAT